MRIRLKNEPMLALNDKVALVAFGGILLSFGVWAGAAYLNSSFYGGRSFADEMFEPDPTAMLARLSVIVLVLFATLLTQMLYARRLRVEAALRQEQSLTLKMYEQSPMSILRVSKDRKVLYANPAAMSVATPPPFQGAEDACCYEGRARGENCESCPIDEVFDTAQSRERVIYTAADGVERWTEQTVYPVLDQSGKVSSVMMSLRDVSERGREEQAMQQLAMFDQLTGLPNRALYSDHLELALNRARRLDEIIAIVFMDLNGFKAINDNRGHAAGDAVLVEVGRRLASVLRAEDTVARYGGDEYTVVARITKVEDVTPLVNRIFTAFEEPHRVGDDVLPVGASLGVAVFPSDAEDGPTLLELADAAMYRTKGQGHCAWAQHGVDGVHVVAKTATEQLV